MERLAGANESGDILFSDPGQAFHSRSQYAAGRQALVLCQVLGRLLAQSGKQEARGLGSVDGPVKHDVLRANLFAIKLLVSVIVRTKG